MTALKVLQICGVAAMMFAVVVILRADDTTARVLGVVQLLGGAGMLVGGLWEQRNRSG